MEWKRGEERAGEGAEGAPTGWLSCVLANGLSGYSADAPL